MHTTEIYDMLLAGERVTIRASNFRQAENLRIYLTKRHREFVAVGIAADSLLFDWNAKASEASYMIGKPRRAVGVSFEVVSHVKLPVQETLGSDTEQYGSSSSPLSEGASGDTDSSSAEVQMPAECPAESDGVASIWETPSRED